MFKKILIFGLPVYLYGLESLMKALASIQSDSVAGPTLAGAALSFLLPLTEFKPVPLPPSTQRRLNIAGANAHLTKDKNFVDLVWLVFFLSLGGWRLSLYLTFKPLRLLGGFANDSFALGVIIYLAALALSLLKERP
jgi:hypothetical protein